jgi:dihydrolipoamide dehydrogenase
MVRTTHDLVVIGAGPGGYVAAIRAAQLGLDVGCVEKERALGGTCLRIGCIPSKALLESSERFWEAKEHLAQHGIKAEGVRLDLKAMLNRKSETVAALARGIDGLFRKHRITRYTGHARLEGPGRVVVDGADGRVELAARHVLIATGSSAASIPGVELDGERIGTSTEALAYPEVPGHLVVIGAGAIGLELGSVWRRLGSTVTVLELLDRILPGIDAEIARDAQRILEKQGLAIRLGAHLTGARVTNGGCEVTVEGSGPITCDRLLVAVGRVPNTEGLGLSSAGITPDERGFIPVDGAFATVTPGIHAIGDVIGGAMLAHKAEEEGIACVERLVTGYGHVNYDAIPNVVYTHPEVASVGRTEEELEATDVPFRKGVFPFLANGRARALGQTEGRVKVLAHRDTDRVLGIHIVGARAGDLIAEAAVAIDFGASSEDLARATHAHPTLAEALKEAALAVDDRPIHV